jgi:hypothetical protein
MVDIVLGLAEDAYYLLVPQIHKPGITISAVAAGGGTYGFGAAYGTMQNIARWGLYDAFDPRST